MKISLQLPSYSFEGGPAQLGPKLVEIARSADAAGFEAIWLMDHAFQIPAVGPAEQEMLEPYTTLGHLAAVTQRARLGTLVTGVTYRHPGLLAKAVTTLDVLSQGRAMLGIGAAWFEREHAGLGIPFPPLAERFERLEETLQIVGQMWSDENGPYRGRHYTLAETLNSPQVLSRPRPPILIGGVGLRKTLRLVARHGDACNLFATAPEEFPPMFDALRRHCDEVGRPYEQIEKTLLDHACIAPGQMSPAEVAGRCAYWAEMGFQHVIFNVLNVGEIAPLEAFGKEVIPQVAAL